MYKRTLLALAAMAAIAAVPAAQAHAPKASGWTTVASGLDNPRGIALTHHGDLWIAEAGRGGDAQCFDGPEGGKVCFGNTGAFTLVHKGVQKRIVEGLPSIGDETTGDNADRRRGHHRQRQAPGRHSSAPAATPRRGRRSLRPAT